MMKILIKYTLVCALLFSGIANAQNIDFKRSNFRDDTDGLKEATNAISKGEPFFEEGSLAIFEVRDPGLAFKKALIEFKKAQNFNPNNALNNYRIGVAYIHSTSPYKAIPF